MSKTFDLYEAADFLKMHWQTLRAKAKVGEIPAAKPAKQWVFVKEDLVSYLRSQYATAKPKSQVQLHIAGGKRLCCTSDLNRASGGANSQHRTESAYKNLLKL